MSTASNAEMERPSRSVDLATINGRMSPEDKACARLLQGVIAQAVVDGCARISEREHNLQANTNEYAASAMEFLFGSDSAFAHYAGLLGLDVGSIRNELLNPRKNPKDKKYPVLTDQQRSTIATRANWFVRQQAKILRGAA